MVCSSLSPADALLWIKGEWGKFFSFSDRISTFFLPYFFALTKEILYPRDHWGSLDLLHEAMIPYYGEVIEETLVQWTIHFIICLPKHCTNIILKPVGRCIKVTRACLIQQSCLMLQAQSDHSHNELHDSCKNVGPVTLSQVEPVCPKTTNQKAKKEGSEFTFLLVIRRLGLELNVLKRNRSLSFSLTFSNWI